MPSGGMGELFEQEMPDAARGHGRPEDFDVQHAFFHAGQPQQTREGTVHGHVFLLRLQSHLARGGQRLGLCPATKRQLSWC